MTDPLITKEEACKNARAVLDRARLRMAADYAEGRMTPERATSYERLRAEAARREAIRAAAHVWRSGMDAMDRMTVEDAARACHVPGGPPLTELEDRIRADRKERTIPAPSARLDP